MQRTIDYLGNYQKNLTRLSMWVWHKSCLERLNRIYNLGPSDTIVRLYRETTNQINILNRQQLDILQTILEVDKANYRELLYRRYVLEQDQDTIADTMGYAYRYISEMHTKAINYLNKDERKIMITILTDQSVIAMLRREKRPCFICMHDIDYRLNTIPENPKSFLPVWTGSEAHACHYGCYLKQNGQIKKVYKKDGNW